jgi:LAS superfamily LD-carboxypeptidase LdcB
VNLQEEILRIKSIMIINESIDVIKKNVSDTRLIEILKNIEETKKVNFTQAHFDNEKKLSGDVKPESGGYDQSALNAFKKLQQACKSTGLYYDEDSYRTYEKQAELFKEYIDKFGSISGAMSLRAIPGYSQHHTGKSFDIEPYQARQCVKDNANKYGFIFPYTEDGIRKKEPWHIYYNL